MRARRIPLIVFAVVVFLVVSFVATRWLYTDNLERSAITRLLEAQAAGDADAMRDQLRCPDRRCQNQVRTNARLLAASGTLQIVRYDSDLVRAWGDRDGTVRVVWLTSTRLSTVQCVTVQRRGTPPGRTSVTLVRLSSPIGLTASCP